MAEAGHNNPPSMIQSASEVIEAVSQWLMDHPVVETEVQARSAKVQIDRAKLCLKDMEEERGIRTAPVREQLAGINRDYKEPHTKLSSCLEYVEERLGEFIRAETRRREEEAARRREEAEAAKFAALEAERLEREAAENAAAGELGVDVVDATRQADSAFEAAVKAERQAIRAEKDTHVKIGGGFMRASSLRNKETLIVEDAVAALTQIGLTDGIKEAIVTAARAYRKLHDRLPDGIKQEIRQEL